MVPIGKHVLVNKNSLTIEISSEYESYWKMLRWMLQSPEYFMFDYEVFEGDEEICSKAIVQTIGFEFEVLHERQEEGRIVKDAKCFKNMLEAIEYALDCIGGNTTQSNEFFFQMKK